MRGTTSKKIILIIIALLFLIVIRLFAQSFFLLTKAERFEKTITSPSNFLENYRLILYYQRSCQFYFPFSPIFSKGINKLIYLGSKFEQQRERKLAKAAWLGAKSCIMLSRGFYLPYKNKLRLINKHIASLFNDKNALERSNIKDPDIFYSLLMIIGLLLWIGSGIYIIIKPEKIFYGFTTFLLGYILWILSLYLL